MVVVMDKCGLHFRSEIVHVMHICACIVVRGSGGCVCMLGSRRYCICGCVLRCILPLAGSRGEGGVRGYIIEYGVGVRRGDVGKKSNLDLAVSKVRGL